MLIWLTVSQIEVNFFENLANVYYIGDVLSLLIKFQFKISIIFIYIVASEIYEGT